MAVSLHGRAAADLRFIRSAMERSSAFTAVPGAGGAAMGVIGVVAAVIAAPQPTAERWLLVWLIAATTACALGIVAIRRKAARGGVPLTGVVGRRFALSLSAPLVAGAALTAALAQTRQWSLMPPVWLLLYGAGMVTGSVVSVPVVLALGLCIMAVGVVALATPPEWGNVWLGVGFGGLQIVFGIYIWRKHGG